MSSGKITGFRWLKPSCALGTAPDRAGLSAGCELLRFFAIEIILRENTAKIVRL